MSRPKTSTISIIGHRDLSEQDLSSLKASFFEIISEIHKIEQADVYEVLTAFANGADMLAASALLSKNKLLLNFKVKCVELIVNSLSSIDSKESSKIVQTRAECESNWKTFERVEKKLIRFGKTIESSAHYHFVVNEHLITSADHVIVFWDGIDRAAAGGTSDAVYSILEGVNLEGRKVELKKALRLWHLVTPRADSPSPIGRWRCELFPGLPYPEKFEWAAKFIPFVRKESVLYSKGKKFLRSEVFWKFGLPIVLISLTLFLGTIGFNIEKCWDAGKGETCEFDLEWNDFFRAVNLLTFNNSVIEHENLDIKEIPLALYVARLLGASVVLITFLSALYYFLSSNFKKKAWLFRKRLMSSNDLVAIFGVNEMSLELAHDLKKSGHLPYFLDKSINDELISQLQLHDYKYFIGDVFDTLFISRLRVFKERDVYFFMSADDDNLRALRELDQSYAQYLDSKGNWFKNTAASVRDRKSWKIQLDRRNLMLAGISSDLISNRRNKNAVRLNSFSLNNNIIRDLLINYPPIPVAVKEEKIEKDILIFHFSKITEDLLDQLLKTMHVKMGSVVNLHLFVSDLTEMKRYIKEHYDYLNHPSSQIKEHLDRFKIEVNNRLRLHLHGLEEIPFNLTQTTSFKDILNKDDLSVYFCHESILENQRWIELLKPFFHAGSMKGQRRQVFYYSNLPDYKESLYVEHLLNKDARLLPIVQFGHYTVNCTAEQLKNGPRDILAASINDNYVSFNALETITGSAEDYRNSRKEELSKKNIKELDEDSWDLVSIKLKESNRLSSDHFWVRIHLLGWSPRGMLKNIDRIKSSLIHIPKRLNSLDEVSLIAETEHNRWCIEKLHQGMVCLRDTDHTALPILIEKWNDKNSSFKKDQQALLKHIDLVVFSELYEGKHNGKYYNEKQKDIAMIELMPYLLEKVAFPKSIK